MDYDGSYLTVNLHSLCRNYDTLERMSGAEVAGVLKADAYGLGLEAVARALMGAGCREFFVVTVDEGVKLRAVCPYNIYILGGLHSGNRADMAAHNLIPVLNCLDDIQSYSGVCAIHFDTGMNRLGLSPDETQQIIDNPALVSHLQVRVALSHFVAADEQNSPLTTQQREEFARIHAALKGALVGAKWSLCNSAGLLDGAERYDLVRPGYALYGGNPTPWIEAGVGAGKDFRIEPTVSLRAAILQVRHVKAGMSVGYNATHVFERDTTIATVSLGYADGWMRGFSNKGVLYWKGVPCPIVGRVSMDSFAVDIGHLADKPKAGMHLEVLGENQTIEQAAMDAGTIGYEILTSLGSRYKRVYIGAL